jgi:hypothetical protein
LETSHKEGTKEEMMEAWELQHWSAEPSLSHIYAGHMNLGSLEEEAQSNIPSNKKIPAFWANNCIC